MAKIEAVCLERRAGSARQEPGDRLFHSLPDRVGVNQNELADRLTRMGCGVHEIPLVLMENQGDHHGEADIKVP